MSWQKDLEVMVQKLAGTYLRDVVSIQLCNVVSVDKENMICDCTPIGGNADTDIPSVQLGAEAVNGLVVFPSVGSTVLVATSTRNNFFILMYSQIDSIIYGDGSYGGMARTDNLTTKLNNIENLLNDLVTKYNSHTHVVVVAAAPVTSAPPVPLETGSITPVTQQADISNPNITQGLMGINA